MQPARTPGRRERRGRELVERVIDAAEAELAEHGVEAFSVERVAERADVALQTVYNRVGRRDALLLSAAERALQHDREYMDRAYQDDRAGDLTVEAAAEAYVRFAIEHPAQFRLLAQPPGPPWDPNGADPLSAAVCERIAATVEEQNKRLQDALARAAAEGTARPVDGRLAATALWAMLNGLLSLAWRADRLRSTPAELQALTETAIDILRNGLTNDSRSEPGPSRDVAPDPGQPRPAR